MKKEEKNVKITIEGDPMGNIKVGIGGTIENIVLALHRASNHELAFKKAILLAAVGFVEEDKKNRDK